MRTITSRTMTAATASLAMALLGLPTAASASEATHTHDLDASVVWVDVEFPAVVEVPWADETTSTYSTTVMALCTGFFVSDEGDIATAGHCVEADAATEISAISNVMADLRAEGWDLTGLTPTNVDWWVGVGEPTAYVGQPQGITDGIFSGQSMMIAQIVDFQGFTSGDNALLRVADLDSTPGLAIAQDTPVRGEQVTAIGFPGSVSGPSDPQRQAPSYKTGTVSSRQYTERGVPNTEIDAAVSGGMSGGPAVNGEGVVIGVNSFKIHGETQPFNFITDTKTLRDFLTRNGVALVDPAPAPTTESGTTPDTTDRTTDATTATAAPVETAPGTPVVTTAEDVLPLAQAQPPAPAAGEGQMTSPLLWVGGGVLALMLLAGGLLLGRLTAGGRAVA